MAQEDKRANRQKEVDDNFAVFKKLLEQGKIPDEKYGKFALMKDREITGYYTTSEDAYQAGILSYKDGLFSIQEVTQELIDLGYYSHAVT